MSRDKLPQKVALTFKFLPLEDSKMATKDPLICSLYKKTYSLYKNSGSFNPLPWQKNWSFRALRSTIKPRYWQSTILAEQWLISAISIYLLLFKIFRSRVKSAAGSQELAALVGILAHEMAQSAHRYVHGDQLCTLAHLLTRAVSFCPSFQVFPNISQQEM